MPLRRPTSRAALAAALLALSAAPAGAQDGVVVDPDSPTAKEYAIPLDDARRTGAGKKGRPGATPARPGAAATPAPLFGEGVGEEDDGSAGAAGGGTRGSGGSGSGGSGSPGSGGSAETSGSGTASQESRSGSTAIPASRPGAPDGGGIGTVLVVIAAGLGVVLVGALAGYALRRRPSPADA